MKKAFAAGMLAALMACGGTDSGGGAGSGGTGGTGGSAGSGGAGGTGGTGCTPFNLDTSAPDTCNGDDVCLGGACVPAFPRHYQMTVSGKVNAHKQDGSDWDPDGSPPDPYVSIFIDGTNVFPNGTTLFQSTPLSDTLTVPAESTIANLTSANPSAKGDMWDGDDAATDDLIVGCDTFTLTAAILRSGFSCAWPDKSTVFELAFQAQ